MTTIEQSAKDLVAFRVSLAEVLPISIAAGIGTDTFEACTSDLTPDPGILELVGTQPEHTRSAGDYVNALVSQSRIENGGEMHRRHSTVLNAIKDQFGVPPEILVAIWGIESNYGQQTGRHAVLRSLATLMTFDQRRREFWRQQFVAALEIIQFDDIPAELLTGSWAGAMGHTQFIPTTYRRYAVDFDGDGRRDIWKSVPDALASAANYLMESGWQAGSNWGFEVHLPDAFDYAENADNQCRPLGHWLNTGIIAVRGDMTCQDAGDHRLLLPAGAQGPAFLVNANFDAVLTYNAAVPYALAVVHLADRIAGRPPISHCWPTEPPLDRSERTELQQHLVDLGYETGGIDGILGRASRKAIRDYQLANSLTADGFHSRAVLDHLRGT